MSLILCIFLAFLLYYFYVILQTENSLEYFLILIFSIAKGMYSFVLRIISFLMWRNFLPLEQIEMPYTTMQMIFNSCFSLFTA